MFEFRLKFHWSLIPASNWQFSNIGSVNGLATGVIAIVWTNDGYQVYRRIYASLGLIGLSRLYWDRLSHFSPYAFIVFWIVLVYCMPQFYMGSNKDFFELNLNLNLTRHSESINDAKTRIFAHHPRVSLARLTLSWWRHNRLAMTP